MVASDVVDHLGSGYHANDIVGEGHLVSGCCVVAGQKLVLVIVDADRLPGHRTL